MPLDVEQNLVVASVLVFPHEVLGFVLRKRTGGEPEELDIVEGDAIIICALLANHILEVFDLIHSQATSAIEVMVLFMVVLVNVLPV